MIRLSFETKLDREAILNKAVTYFEEIGLKLKDRAECCFLFESPTGFVRVTLEERDDKTEVEVESREYEYFAKEFIKQFK